MESTGDGSGVLFECCVLGEGVCYGGVWVVFEGVLGVEGLVLLLFFLVYFSSRVSSFVSLVIKMMMAMVVMIMIEDKN